MLLQDPTDRAFSSWSMNANWDSFCDKEDKSVATLCVERTFRDTFNAWHNSFSRPECRFTTPVRPPPCVKLPAPLRRRRRRRRSLLYDLRHT